MKFAAALLCALVPAVAAGAKAERKLDAETIAFSNGIPDHCAMETFSKEVECPPKPPLDLPRTCNGASASFWGDPHMTTFDDVEYNCFGEGEFHLIKSMNSDFSLQGRFIRYDPNKAGDTVTSGLVLNTGVEGDPTIQVTIPRLHSSGCAPTILIDGVETTLGDYQVIQGVEIQSGASKDGFPGFIFYFTKSELQLQVYVRMKTVWGCMLTVDICIPDCFVHRFENLVGLLGTPDGNPKNDWMAADGQTVLDVSSNGQEQLDFCTKQWCIDDEADSNFIYLDGDDFDKFHKCGVVPDLDTQACVDNPPNNIAEICGTSPQCLVDGCVGGPELAKASVGTTIDMLDKNCGSEVFLEDFEGPVAGQLGEIHQKGVSSMNDEDGKAATHFLLLHKNSKTVDFTFDVPADSDLVLIEFLLYEIGGWENSGGSKDYVWLTVDGTKIDIGPLKEAFSDGSKEGFLDGIKWTRDPLTNAGNLGFSSSLQNQNKDQIHKVQMKIPSKYYVSDGKLEFNIEVYFSGSKSGESAGFDDIHVVSFSKDCKINCSGNMVIFEDFNSGVSGWGDTTSYSEGRVILGPMTWDSAPVVKNFAVSTYSASAKIKFLLYEMDNVNPLDNVFLVTIGNIQFELGFFGDSDNKPFEYVGGTEDTIFTAEHGATGDESGIVWYRKPISVETDLGFDAGTQDVIHDVTIEVPAEYIIDGSLYVSFVVNAVDQSTKTSFGIDDFKLTVYPEHALCAEAKAAYDAAKASAGDCEAVRESLVEAHTCYENEMQLVCQPTPSPTEPPTDSPTESPTEPVGDRSFAGPPKPKVVYAAGDPHIKKWNDDMFDFMGECDLVLIQNPDFNNGQGLHVHIRTTMVNNNWSYISSAAVQIGDDILEVHSGIEDRHYWVNKKEGHRFLNSRNLDFTIGGFSGRFRAMNEHTLQYRIYLPNEQAITIKSVKNWLKVGVDEFTEEDFGKSTGLMGTFGEGSLVGRDGTVFEDTDMFSQHWQVSPADPQLFHEAEGPQFPEQCRMPSAEASTSRRLASSISEADAREACAQVAAQDFENCVYDVLITDDTDAVGSY